MSGATFGRKGDVEAVALAARRAAFLAEERARAPRSGSAVDQGFALHKSAATAYLLWFFLGGVSAHRFYLGYTISAAIQLALGPLCWLLLLTGSLWAFVPLIGAGLWILADAFLIPSMARDANDRGRRNATASVFV